MLPLVSTAVAVALIDHGLESPSERLAASKPIVGTIKLSASTDGNLLKISISDDGQGINWDRVRQRAMSFGLEHHSQERLVDALFHDGLSTSEMVTELSGRGVGLSAVRQACSQVNGTITVESSQRAGTAFVFTFDLSQLSCSFTKHRSTFKVDAFLNQAKSSVTSSLGKMC